MSTEPVDLDEAAVRLLEAVDRLPVRLSERERVVRALDMVSSTEWDRVVLRLPDEQLRLLRLPSLLFHPDHLVHVVGVAKVVASGYGFRYTGVAHIAVALVLTSRSARDSAEAAVEVVAEAFGLGHLERPFDALEVYLADEEPSTPVDRPEVPERYISKQGERVHRKATILHVGVRLLVAGLILFIAVRQGSLLLGLVALISLVAARDSRKQRLRLGDEVGPLSVWMRWPLPAFVIVLCCSAGQTLVAWLLIISMVSAEVIALRGEMRTAVHHLYLGGPMGPYSRKLASIPTLPESFITYQRYAKGVITWRTAVVPTAIVVLWLGPTVYGPLYVLVAYLIAKKLSGFATVILGIALAMSLLLASVSAMSFTPITAVFALCAGAAARVRIARHNRPPQPEIPVPPGMLLRELFGSAGKAERRVRRLLRQEHAAAAVQLIDATAERDRLVFIALRGWALIQLGRYSEAKATVAGLTGDWEDIRDLVRGVAELELGNHGKALEILEALAQPAGDSEWERSLGIERGIALLRATAKTRIDRAFCDTVAAAIPDDVVTRDGILPILRLLRLTAEVLARHSPVLSSYVAGEAYFLVHWAFDDYEIRQFSLVDEARSLFLEMSRCAAMNQIDDLRTGQSSTDDEKYLGTRTGAANFLLRLDRPLEAAALLNTLADHLETTTQRLAALENRLHALAVLHWMRHRMTDLEERRLWWHEAGETLKKGMRQAAAGKDWSTLAELIESARLQLGPDDGESALPGTAPFIRVGGVSRLETAAWYQPHEEPTAYAVEEMAACLLGPGTWWWSTWAVGDSLYWTLVTPGDNVMGGVMSTAKGSPLGAALAELRDALPIPYPGEDGDDELFERRMEHSALFGPLRVEMSLAKRLGELLPAELRTELMRSGAPLRLAIAPAHSLANVPWAMVAVPDDHRGVRLIERCKFAIAPPSALLATVTARAAAANAPLRLAVLNPGGAQASETEFLDAADGLVDAIPAGVKKITSADVITVDDFGAVLREVPSGSSAVFACHTDDGGGAPLEGGLLLRPGPEPEILSAGTLMTSRDRFPIPEQVLVLACESSDLRQAAEGEWLVLGPALLWAGARRLVVTSFPVPDDDVIDRALIARLHGGTDLADDLREVQLERLDRWRASGGEDAFPMTWAGHVAMGVFGQVRLRALATRQVAMVHRGVVRFVDGAAAHAARRGRSRVEVIDLLHQAAVYGWAEHLPARHRRAVNGFAWVSYWRHRLGKRVPATTADIELGHNAVELIRAAASIARMARHRVVHPEHLLVALLSDSSRSSKVARLLSGLDGRVPEVVRELVDDTQENLQHVELPEVERLSAAAIARIYGACGAAVATPSDITGLLLEEFAD